MMGNFKILAKVLLLTMVRVRPNKTKTKTMFPVARAHCILTTKFAHIFFLITCIFDKPFSVEKHATKWYFNLNMLKTSNIWVCFWLICERNIKKDMTPTYIIVCNLSCSIDKKLRIAVFLLLKLKVKMHRAEQFLDVLLETYLIFLV